MRFEMLSSSLLDPLNWVAMRPICANIIEESCLLLSSFSLETSIRCGAFCLVVTVQERWWRRVCWQPVYNLSSRLLNTWSLSLWHAVCLSTTLWRSQWDTTVWNEYASMMSWCSLVDGRLYCNLKVMLSTFRWSRRPLLWHLPIPTDLINPS